MDKVRIGIIGLGNMGRGHAKYLLNGEIPNGELTAICDVNPAQLQWAKENLDDKIALFDSMEAMIASGIVDGVLVATPHYDHPSLAIKALEGGMHVLVEKPAGVYTKQVREMNEAAQKSGKVFGIMYNQRTNPLYQKLRDLIQSGELGELKRTNWIITNWYRPQSYYNSGGWRATWAGEGGGVLLNQDPHQLDLWQWTCGMPKRVRAFCSFGKYHDIEVEDDVTAYVEYENGATGVFVTCTGEAPGTNRFEVSGDMGKIVIENDQMTFWRNRISERRFNAEYTGGFGSPEYWKCEIPIPGAGGTQHPGITSNWVQAILKGTPLLAPGIEGINGLSISNAIHLSAWTDSWIELPLDEDLFYKKLQERISTSTFKKEVTEVKTLDISGTH
jgi:predicted dehydrogenase